MIQFILLLIASVNAYALKDISFIDFRKAMLEKSFKQYEGSIDSKIFTSVFSTNYDSLLLENLDDHEEVMVEVPQKKPLDLFFAHFLHEVYSKHRQSQDLEKIMGKFHSAFDYGYLTLAIKTVFPKNRPSVFEQAFIKGLYEFLSSENLNHQGRLLWNRTLVAYYWCRYILSHTRKGVMVQETLIEHLEHIEHELTHVLNEWCNEIYVSFLYEVSETFKRTNRKTPDHRDINYRAILEKSWDRVEKHNLEKDIDQFYKELPKHFLDMLKNHHAKMYYSGGFHRRY